MVELRSSYNNRGARGVDTNITAERRLAWFFAVLLLVLGTIMVAGGAEPIGYILLVAGIVIGVYKIIKLERW